MSVSPVAVAFFDNRGNSVPRCIVRRSVNRRRTLQVHRVGPLGEKRGLGRSVASVHWRAAPTWNRAKTKENFLIFKKPPKANIKNKL
jgi:hypothetical protein